MRIFLFHEVIVGGLQYPIGGDAGGFVNVRLAVLSAFSSIDVFVWNATKFNMSAIEN